MGRGRDSREPAPGSILRVPISNMLRIPRVLGAILLAASRGSGAPTHDAPDLVQVREGFQRWLADSDLSPAFELQKVRWGRRPDQPEREWLKLELTLKPAGWDPHAEDARFKALLQDYRGKGGATLAETLFYKFVEVGGVARADAVVNVFLIGGSYAVFIEDTNHELVVQPGAGRSTERFVDLEALAPTTARRRNEVDLPVRGASDDPAPRIRSFLIDYFQKKGDAVRVTAGPHEPYYARVTVEGLRKTVMRGNSYWERLEVSIAVTNGKNGPRAICLVSGKYASGRGARLPDASAYYDMDPDHRAELESFVDQMLASLQESLALRT